MIIKKITPVGTSLGLTLPKKELDRLGIAKGSRIGVVVNHDGTFTLTPLGRDPQPQEVAAFALDVASERRRLLDLLD
jgi:antitoxin component of MazEF toxin-antitoxin module